LEFATNSIRSTVKLHLTSDVPVGVFLSGGLDSASIAGLMVDFGVNDLKGVTLKFNEYKNLNNDEVPAAKKIADHFGIDHHVKIVCKQEFNSDLPKIIDAMDQPSIDGVNTWYASKALSEMGLKVVLSGIGGDELFSGYPSFKRIPPALILRNYLDKVNFLLPILDYAFRRIANKKDDRRWNYFLDWSRSVEGAWLLSRGVYSVSDLTVLMCQKSVNFDPKLFIQDIVGEISASPILAISQMESSVYLKNQLLRDSDWASMSHSLELRTPLVDHILLQQIQPFKKYLFNKFALVNAPINKLPSSVLNRKKTGFNTPVNDWLQESMKKNGSGSSRTTASTICELYSDGISF
jgi:asparagine synthase (glutamine-hydrolysing)